MSVNALQQTPPSTQDLFNNIYLRDIPRSDNQSTLPPSNANIPHSNPNNEPCTNPNMGSQPTHPILRQPNRTLLQSNRTLLQSNRIWPQSTQNRICLTPKW